MGIIHDCNIVVYCCDATPFKLKGGLVMDTHPAAHPAEV